MNGSGGSPATATRSSSLEASTVRTTIGAASANSSRNTAARQRDVLTSSGRTGEARWLANGWLRLSRCRRPHWPSLAWPASPRRPEVGRLELLHWLHGIVIPAAASRPFSGASQIYPPIGALANAVGGLAAARILSLCFMLLSTVLLYLVTGRLAGIRAAVAGCALWALSEPVLRLAFATYDPLACLLVILSAWLAVQAAVRSRRGELVALSALSLALGSVTAFSFAIYIPVVVLFAFFTWRYLIGPRQALWCGAWLGLTAIVTAAALMTFLHLWAAAVSDTVARPASKLAQTLSPFARSPCSFHV